MAASKAMMRPVILSRPENVADLLAIFCDGGSAATSSPGCGGGAAGWGVPRGAAGAGGEADRPPRRRRRAGAMAAIARPLGEPAAPAPGMADPDTAAARDSVGLDSAGRDSADPADTADRPAAGGRSARSTVAVAAAQTGLRTG